MPSPFLAHLKRQNDLYGAPPAVPLSSSSQIAAPLYNAPQPPAPSISSAPSWPPRASTSSAQAPIQPGYVASAPHPLVSPPPLRPVEAPKGPRTPRPLPQPPPKPAALQRRPPSGLSDAPPPRARSPQGGFSQTPATYAAASSQPSWAAEHARATETYPELPAARQEPARPVRTYEAASSSYVGGMAKLNLDARGPPSIAVDEPPGISVAPPPAIVEPPSIHVGPPSVTVNDLTPTFAFSAEDVDAAPVVNVVSRSAAAKRAAAASPDGALVCAECDSLIAGKIVTAMSRRFHPGCFKCAQCGLLLEHIAFHERDGLAYCHVDFHELFTIRCDHCKTPIIDESYVTIEDSDLGGRKNYHELHFFCAQCGDPFIDPKSLARRSAISANPALREPEGAERPEVEAKPFVVHQGYAYCEACDISMRAPRCARCRKPIAGDILKALGKQWHPQCFVCESCDKPFETASFFTRQDKPYCERCYTAQLRAEIT